MPQTLSILASHLLCVSDRMKMGKKHIKDSLTPSVCHGGYVTHTHTNTPLTDYATPFIELWGERSSGLCVCVSFQDRLQVSVCVCQGQGDAVGAGLRDDGSPVGIRGLGYTVHKTGCQSILVVVPWDLAKNNTHTQILYQHKVISTHRKYSINTKSSTHTANTVSTQNHQHTQKIHKHHKINNNHST